VTTITTVGCGDRFPMSSAGRAVAVVLMIAGIAMFGVITATIAAYFVEQQAEEDVASRLDQIMERLDRIEAGMRAGEDQHALEHLRRWAWSLLHVWETHVVGSPGAVVAAIGARPPPGRAAGRRSRPDATCHEVLPAPAELGEIQPGCSGLGGQRPLREPDHDGGHYPASDRYHPAPDLDLQDRPLGPHLRTSPSLPGALHVTLTLIHLRHYRSWRCW
jgi:Ion channel